MAESAGSMGAVVGNIVGSNRCYIMGWVIFRDFFAVPKHPKPPKGGSLRFSLKNVTLYRFQ